MRTYPIDCERVRLISTGNVTPIVKWIELSDGARRPDPQGRQETDDQDRPLWRVEVIMPADEGDERDKTGVTEITIASKDEPAVGSFGEVLVFEGLSMQPGYLQRKTGQLTAPRWTADGIKRKPGQQHQGEHKAA